MRKHTTIAGAVIIAVLAAGCGTVHATSASGTPSISASSGLAHGNGLASVPGADAKTVLIKAGVPLNGTSAQQVAFVKSLASKQNRHALAVKLQIPAGPQRTAFENVLWTDVKADHVITVTGINHAGLKQFLDTDLPNAYASYA